MFCNKSLTFASGFNSSGIVDNKIREIKLTQEFQEYYNSLGEKIQQKYDYIFQIISTQYVVSEKFIKHLENTVFYEMRVSVSTNEYRTILFTIDADNFMEAKNIILLNSFLKKDTKQYKSEIQKANKILESLEG